MKHYIASGFFDENQMNQVIAVENELDSKGEQYFSPRSITMDLSPNNPDRIANILKIFEVDTKEIDNADVIDIILDKKNDIGTLFELGYAIGKQILHEPICIREVLHHQAFDYIPTDSGFRDFDSTEWTKEKSILSKYLVKPYSSDEMEDLSNYPVGISSRYGYYPENFRALTQLILNAMIVDSTPVFLVDDYPIVNFIAMGVLHKLGIPFYTTSLKGYGSNVMIAASSIGHIESDGKVTSMFNNNNIE